MRSVSQQGFALVGVLIIVGLITSASVAMAIRQTVDIDMTYQVMRSDQSALHAKAIELWAANVLKQDQLQNNIDTEQDNWNQTLQDVPMEQGTVSAEIKDLQGRFNINNLLLTTQESDLQLSRFKRLLNILGLDEKIADAVLDWIDHDTETRFPNGAEDDYYLSLKTAYRSANQVIHDVSELRKVRGIDQQTYERLLPYVVALPVGSEININTASPEVIMSLAKGIGLGEATRISQTVQEQSVSNALPAIGGPTGDVSSNDDINLPDDAEGSASYTFQYQQWLEDDGGSENIGSLASEGQENDSPLSDNSLLQAAGIDSQGVSLSSRYFLLKGVVELDGEALIIGSILFRDENNGDVYTVARKYGEFYYH